MTLTKVCTYAECFVPPERHDECAAAGITKCWGVLEHQHVPKRSQGGKECHVMLCAAHHDNIDNGTRYEGLRLGDAIQTVNGKAFYRIFDRDKHNLKGHALVWIEIGDGDDEASSVLRVQEATPNDLGEQHAEGQATSPVLSLHPTESRCGEGRGASLVRVSGGVPSSEVESADTDGGDHPSTALVDTKGSHLRPPAPPSVSVDLGDVPWVDAAAEAARPRPTSDFKRWQAVGQALKSNTQQLKWLLGDWLVEGERFGEEAWQFIDELFVNEQSVAQYEKVARAFPPEARRDDLSWSHHRRLAYTVESTEERTEWLLRASKGEWTRDELVLQLKGGTEVRETHPCPDCGAVHGVKA